MYQKMHRKHILIEKPEEFKRAIEYARIFFYLIRLYHRLPPNNLMPISYGTKELLSAGQNSQ